MKENFISQLLQFVGYLSAIAVALSQYLLRDSFKNFFTDPRYYSASSLVALILCVVLILSIFSNRYYLSMKIYFSKKNKEKYFAQFRATPAVTDANQNPTRPSIPEPRGFTIKSIALVLIFIAIIAFGCFIYFPINISQVISYIIFISSIVASITIYATTLYLENDFKVQQKIKYDRVIEKTKEYFAGDIQVEASWQDDSNITQPLRRMIIHRSGKKYNVVANSNDPEKFFSVSELIQPN